MKENNKVVWDQMPRNAAAGNGRSITRFMTYTIVFFTSFYLIYTLNLLFTARSCPNSPPCNSNCSVADTIRSEQKTQLENKSTATAVPSLTEFQIPPESKPQPSTNTSLRHIVFGIAASSNLWKKRKEYIKIWWRPKEMRGIVWLDRAVKNAGGDKSLPQIKISGDTSKFSYKNRQGHRSAIRISRIVSETIRLGLPDVHWFVMGDDDTFFVPENLVRVLNRYDHRQFYYIGSQSESHLQNIYFSYNMAYGGGGFAISRPLAEALEKMQDRCIQRYPGLYGSDDRMQACMAELGVPLTKEPGFHQYDVYGNLFGLLAAHPIAPLVSIHHLDVVEPIFPNLTRTESLKRIMEPVRVDSAGLMQQSICYDKERHWTVSVSWGFAVQIFRGVFSPREMEMPARTFLNWYRRADYTAYAFNTRPWSRHPCQKPFVFYYESMQEERNSNRTTTRYGKFKVPPPSCRWKMVNPAAVEEVVVYKETDPFFWNKSPRRKCCRVLRSEKKGSVGIEVGECKDGEIMVS